MNNSRICEDNEYSSAGNTNPCLTYIYIAAVSVVIALDLCKHLRVEIVVLDGDLSDLCHIEASLAPSGEFGNEMIRRGELDVDADLFLQSSDRLKCARRLGIHFQVNIDRALAKIQRKGGTSPHQIDRSRTCRLSAQFLKKHFQLFQIRGTAHTAQISGSIQDLAIRQCRAKPRHRLLGQTAVFHVERPKLLKT